MKTPVLESLFNKVLHKCFSEAILKNFANSTGKLLCCSHFLKTLTRLFSCEIFEIDTHFTKHLQWLLLNDQQPCKTRSIYV